MTTTFQHVSLECVDCWLMYITQAHLSYYHPSQVQSLGKGGVVWSTDLLPDLVCSYDISSEYQKYFSFWIQLWNVLGNVSEMWLVHNCTWRWNLRAIIQDFMTLYKRW